MSFALACVSHSPMMNFESKIPPDVKAAVMKRLGEYRTWVNDFDPEVVIKFGPDHFGGFFYDLMPQFCIGIQAESVGDFGSVAGPVSVPSEIALQCAEHVMAEGIDIAVSHRMKIDHGLSQAIDRVLGGLEARPVIPIFINCAAPPRASCKRARLLGEAVGRFAKSLGKRVLFMGSGGISHDPPVPRLKGAPPEVVEYMMGAGRNPPPEVRAMQVSQGREWGELLAEGTGPSQALNPAWDAEILKMLESGDLQSADAFDDAWISEKGGAGGHEIRNWIAAFSALKIAGGGYQAQQDYYHEVPHWVVAYAMMRATPKSEAAAAAAE